VGLDGIHNIGPSLSRNNPLGNSIQVNCTKVGRHHNDCVSHIHDAPLTISQPSIVQHLQEQCDKLSTSFFDFVDKDDTVRLSANVFGKLATRVVSNIAWR